ncbi:MAG TPA: tyrosine-type recombinase/integrase [Anaerolineales bacterium]
MPTVLALAENDLPLPQQPHVAYLASLSSTESRRTMAKALGAIVAVLMGDLTNIRDRSPFSRIPWHKLTHDDTAAIRATLLEQYSPATVRVYLSALRGVLYQAWKLGQMSSEDYQEAADLEGVPGETPPAGRELKPEELASLMEACQKDRTPAGSRDGAIIALLYAAGLRRAELVAVSCADYDPMSGRLLVRGKQNKYRSVYITNEAADAVQDWLIVRGFSDGPLFVSINRGGVLGSSLSTQAVYNVLAKRGQQAGVTNFSPHDLRRSFVHDLLDGGEDISRVAQLAGHASVTTTARYGRRRGENRKKLARLFHFRYRKRH